MRHNVTMIDRITRDLIKRSPKVIFLFGDNLLGKGFGGQAREMRGEPNVVGIPTKKAPSMNPAAFFNDAEFEDNKRAIDRAFARIPDGWAIVIPSAGIGTGLAQLEQRAPRTSEYLQTRLHKLQTTGEV